MIPQVAVGPVVVPNVEGGVWDLLVIGGGAAGLVGARTAASFGASVLLVEWERTGGDCLWTGCVPSKALLAAASAAADARAAGRLGVYVERVRVDFAEVMAHVRAAITTIESVDSADALRAAGVQVAIGTARFTGAWWRLEPASALPLPIPVHCQEPGQASKRYKQNVPEPTQTRSLLQRRSSESGYERNS